ncbi:DUF1820 family protein [Permianibacter sp. IMCC34836]|uniref:DUF1820 family protein n=1 Tax=Permianibacter fluminis TaxID=2738515 RepID=UPI0015537299|nr:DUF1820 family protein [Permianibacter fluminis]NQD37048.1 DUF1820 family protein [Permianibacter fluminis]
MSEPRLYRVIFLNQGQHYELYARYVYQSDMWGFVEIEELVFGERSQLLVDPAEEKLKNEFDGVRRSYIPAHAIVRIDEVSKVGEARITDGKGENVTPFPAGMPRPTKKPE